MITQICKCPIITLISITSTRECGWIVSDCTAEGLKALLLLDRAEGLGDPTPPSRLYDCVDTLLQMQNSDGGYASYERKRGGAFLEVRESLFLSIVR